MRQIALQKLDRLNRFLESGASRNDSFLGGQLGLVYYYFHLYNFNGDEAVKTRGEELLQEVFANFNSGYPRLVGTSFSTGGAGLGYVVNALAKGRFINFDITAEFAEFDRYLFNTAVFQIEDDFIDFLHGALGVVHYFTEREDSPIINQYLDELVLKTCERAIKKDAGYWFRNYVIKLEEKENINFGLSHGLTGILLILLNTYSRSAHKEMLETVIMEGIRFIRKYKMDVDFSNDEYSVFPFIVKEKATEIMAPNRLGWCYGDLNEVLLFYRAGHLFGNQELTNLADVIGSQTLMRKTSNATLVDDSNFCHGAAGLSQFYRKLYQEGSLAPYKEAYEYWIEQTILLLDKDLDNGLYAGKEHEMLDGLTGIAFSLLSYVSDHELSWSKSVLL